MAFLPASIQASEQCEHWIAKSGSVEGDMLVMRKSSTSWTSTIAADTYCPGDKIRVGRLSRATVIMANESILRLGPNTTLSFIRGQQKDKRALVRIFKGVVNFFSRVPKSLDIETPFVNGSVEGTELLVQVDENEASILVFKGLVIASNDYGRLNVASGQAIFARKGMAPEYRVLVQPRDAVHWALYYPAVLDSQVSAIRNAVDLLNVGQADEAENELNQLLTKQPDSSDAYTLKSVIALVQNRKKEALSLADKAVQLDLRSAAAKIALSYVQQAHFDIQTALKTLEDAVQDEPQNSLAKARLAELYLSTGELDKALETAKAAAVLNPSVGHIQTVLGFVYLAQIETDKAEAVFNKAIVLDQGAPLPRLGLGLVKIKQGSLEEGRTDIDLAAALDLKNSLIRSYLGKVYYEEKRDKLARRQFIIAKELDPLDPTPYLYDAILKQANNQPVEALSDIQKSIDLNDNRAVYRSRLLLDEDLAVRSASLARIYSDLGFEKLALVEGWKSVNTDPGSHSAHRFLADSYGALPRHEIARVSELLQAQLLQPVNITPVQPQLAEKNLYILDGTGPAEASFNEFSPLFNRNRIAFLADGTFGGNGIFGDDLVVSGVWGRHSWSMGQFHYETDGFRENNDQDQDIYNAFYQVNLSHKTSLQAEYRYKDIDKGDLPLRFYPDEFLPTLREQDRDWFVRLGLHHIFTPQSEIIGSLVHGNEKANLKIPPEYGASLENKRYQGELQYLYHSKLFNVTSGFGHLSIDQQEERTFMQLSLGEEDSDIKYTNGYIYTQLNILENMTWVLGGSADSLDGGFADNDLFNPKIGVTWSPFQNTTLRAAAFRTLRGPQLFSQTIEPTQVAGFNQFFDDFEGTKSWRYGLGIDQKISAKVNAGAEISQRQLDVPYEDFVTLEVLEADWRESLARIYLYWAPHPYWALSAEYQYERLEREIENPGTEGIVELKTHRVPLRVNFFHSSGFSGQVKATYVGQEGEFGDIFSGVVSDDDQFWVVDASIQYRLPKRWGLLSLEARNLFNENFNFLDTDPVNPSIYPERVILTRFTVAF
jgi:Tfp pilus assembly protein PilF